MGRIELPITTLRKALAAPDVRQTVHALCTDLFVPSLGMLPHPQHLSLSVTMLGTYAKHLTAKVVSRTSSRRLGQASFECREGRSRG